MKFIEQKNSSRIFENLFPELMELHEEQKTVNKVWILFILYFRMFSHFFNQIITGCYNDRFSSVRTYMWKLIMTITVFWFLFDEPVSFSRLLLFLILCFFLSSFIYYFFLAFFLSFTLILNLLKYLHSLPLSLLFFSYRNGLW